MRTKKKTKRKTKRKGDNSLNDQKKLILEMLRELKWPRTQRPNVIRESARPSTMASKFTKPL